MFNFGQEVAQHIKLDNLGDEIEIPLRYSAKSKRVSIKLKHDGVVITLPSKWYLKSAISFANKQESWIRKKLEHLQNSFPQNDSHIPVLGNDYLLNFIDSKDNKVIKKENILHVYAEIDKRTDVLIKYLQNILFNKIEEIIAPISDYHNLPYKKIKLSRSKCKWGSCSSNRVLSFNWRLVFAPITILQYVIVHELCHIVEMNHSKSFWELVQIIYPNQAMAKKWLKINGLRLHLFLK